MATAIRLPEVIKVSDLKKEWKKIKDIRDELKNNYLMTDPWLENQFNDLGFELHSGKIFHKNLPAYRKHVDKAWDLVEALEEETAQKSHDYRKLKKWM